MEENVLNILRRRAFAMNKNRIKEISKDRLDQWIDLLVKDHATPVVLIAVGHDHRSGIITLCMVEDLSTTQVLRLLEAIQERLR